MFFGLKEDNLRRKCWEKLLDFVKIVDFSSFRKIRYIILFWCFQGMLAFNGVCLPFFLFWHLAGNCWSYGTWIHTLLIFVIFKHYEIIYSTGVRNYSSHLAILMQESLPESQRKNYFNFSFISFWTSILFLFLF